MRPSEIKGVGTVTEEKLKEIGIFSAEDLIERLPRSYIDMDAALSFEECIDGDLCVFEAKIITVGKPIRKGKLSILRVGAERDGQKIGFVWYNQPYYAKVLQSGSVYKFYGKLRTIDGEVFFYNPKIDSYDGEKFNGIRPVYGTKGLISQSVYAKAVEEALKVCMPKTVLEKQEKTGELTPLSEAYRRIHFPVQKDISKEKERIVLEKLVKRICAFRLAKALYEEQRVLPFLTDTDFTEVTDLLPFCLSESQKNAVECMKNKLRAGLPLNAILCGDVGSGKTVVAILLSYFVIKNGYQVLFMAPTSLLAKQHYTTVSKLFLPLGLRVGYIDGGTGTKQKKEIYFEAERNGLDIIIGTHSLLNGSLNAKRLGLVITDEQHRFGVAQRTKLLLKGTNVAVLTMSATPIPRSVRLVAYGEMDFFTVERNRASTVKTRIVTKSKRADLWAYVGRKAQEGEQIFIIAPRVFDAEGEETDSVEALTEELSFYVPSELIGSVHGKSKDKQETLNSFYDGTKKVLIATTVVEVGIDVPNATVMVVCDAERFGLATLHQLRGRIGRGDKDGYCFLYTEKEPSEGLKTLVACNNGFEIAEKDFDLRGGGDMFGLEQSGAGTLEGLTVRSLKKASAIADAVDIFAIRNELQDEIRSFCLKDVSLT